MHYILWGISTQTLVMMLADAPRYLTKSEREQAARKSRGGLRGLLAHLSTMQSDKNYGDQTN